MAYLPSPTFSPAPTAKPAKSSAERTRVGLRATQAAHLSGGAGSEAIAIHQREDGASVLVSDNTVGKTFEVFAGETPVAEAVRSL